MASNTVVTCSSPNEQKDGELRNSNCSDFDLRSPRIQQIVKDQLELKARNLVMMERDRSVRMQAAYLSWKKKNGFPPTRAALC
ncbi:hypothetical protein CDL15_Pgr008025 [Punica granatum]|uniref:Uncharacterized protein n=1 Tax=Punica granatum TaxID=22663 RepID=A0A218VS24_PUNGR|nr:hypothetical protein CDL15_Pgr008025 [Punica granatum]PKI63960.1 hypothetical protein CRG98_015636 [Punica granatum]